jgi:hypothetical protein
MLFFGEGIVDTSQFSTAQREAYGLACETLKQRPEADTSRILGLFAGLGEISEDFDAPLPDENLYWEDDTNDN